MTNEEKQKIETASYEDCYQVLLSDAVYKGDLDACAAIIQRMATFSPSGLVDGKSALAAAGAKSGFVARYLQHKIQQATAKKA